MHQNQWKSAKIKIISSFRTIYKQSINKLSPTYKVNSSSVLGSNNNTYILIFSCMYALKSLEPSANKLITQRVHIVAKKKKNK